MRKYTQAERYHITRVLEKVFDVMEATDNDVSLDVSFLGVDLTAYDGKMIVGAAQTYAINDSAAYNCPFTELDAERMIAELSVLEHFNKRETDTTGEE